MCRSDSRWERNGSAIRFYHADTTVAITQPLLKGFGRDVAQRGVRHAEQASHDARRQFHRAEQMLAVDVAAAYYRLVAQASLFEAGLKSLERSRTLVAATEARLAAGLVSQLDVLRVRQVLAQAELQLSDVETAVDDARGALAVAIGRSADAIFDVDRRIPRPAGAVRADEAVSLAFRHRPDLVGLSTRAAEADRTARIARNQLLPQVDINLLISRRETAGSLAASFREGRFQLATFFTISMPVDRTPQTVELQRALIDRGRRERLLEDERRRIGDDINRAIRERDRLERMLDVAASAVSIAEQELEVARLRQDRGLSSALDVLGAEGNLLAAESRRLSVMADTAVAAIRFQALLGVLDPRTDFDAVPSTGQEN
jgi:outer membrane protein TolC